MKARDPPASTGKRSTPPHNPPQVFLTFNNFPRKRSDEAEVTGKRSRRKGTEVSYANQDDSPADSDEEEAAA